MLWATLGHREQRRCGCSGKNKNVLRIEAKWVQVQEKQTLDSLWISFIWSTFFASSITEFQRRSSRQLWKVTTKLPQWWCPPARPTWNTSWQPGLLYVLTLSSMKGIHHTIVHLNIILSFSLLVRISHQNLLRVAFINEVIGWRMIPKSYSTQTHLSNISNSLNLVQGLVQN